MATQPLEIGHLEIGSAYLHALQSLGLDPDALFWAYDEVVGETVLVLVTSQFDHVGPLALSETLFKAYNLAGTPKEIDPFIVRLHSPDHTLIRNVARFLPMRFGGPLAQSIRAELNVGGLRFEPGWIYKFQPSKRRSVDLSRQWSRFARNIDLLAA